MNSTICPFCKTDNQCAVNSESCWCQMTNVPQGLIALLPNDCVNKQCICLTCIESFNKDPITFEEQMNGKTQ